MADVTDNVEDNTKLTNIIHENIKLLNPESPPTNLKEMAKSKGFVGVEAYLRNVSQEEYRRDLEIIRDNWLKAHQKFVSFADMITPDILRALETSKSGTVAAPVAKITEELTKFHMSRPGSMDIHNKTDLVLGLYYYFLDKGIDVTLSGDKKHIMFKRIP